MRTTVTLDPDVGALLQKAMEERGVSFKHALNDAVRSGLISERPVFVQRTASLGEPRVDLTKALDVAAALEDDALTDKLEMRK